MGGVSPRPPLHFGNPPVLRLARKVLANPGRRVAEVCLAILAPHYFAPTGLCLKSLGIFGVYEPVPTDKVAPKTS